MSDKFNGLDLYKITIDLEYSDGEDDLGIDLIAFTKAPAILTKGVAFTSQQTMKNLKFQDDVKMRIAAPALIPMIIYRNDDWGQYYVQFTVDEIELMYKKFMQKLNNQNKFNLEHTSEMVPAYILESILVDTENKMKYINEEYGVDLPLGSVFLVSQITDAEYYKKLVDNEQFGYSIEGFLGLSLSALINKNNTKQEMAEPIMLPPGEHEINGQIYVVKDGQIVEVKEVPVAAAEEVKPEEEVKPVEAAVEEVKPEEEVAVEAAEEGVKPTAEEDKPKEEIKTENLAIDETELMTILQPKFDEINSMIAELRVLINDEESEEEKETPVMMSAAQKRTEFMASLQNFLKK